MTHRKLVSHFFLKAFLMAVFASPLAWAADTASKPEEQMAAAIKVGQAQWLETGSDRFLGIYTKATSGTPEGGAIILPSLGINPDWPDVIAPLREGLPNYSWSTLSIQLPTPTRGSDGLWQLEPYFTASRVRIQAAIAFLEQQGITNIALVGHGLGAVTAVVSLSGTDPLKVSALAAISLGVPPLSAPSTYKPALLENIRIPILDIYGSRDLDEVTQSAAARLVAARQGGRDASHNQHLESLAHSAMARLPTTEQNGYIAYRQLKLMGADHMFRGADDTLVKRVAGWLKKHANAVESPVETVNKS